MKIIFACGGTAGHINPALAIAEEIIKRKTDAEILFIGTEDRMETELIPRAGYEIETIKITNLSRKISFDSLIKNFQTAKNVFTSIAKCKKIFKRFKPDLVIGTGGYVCYPVVSAAHSMGIRSAIHESNAVPGLTTKLLEAKADLILLGYEESKVHYKHLDKLEITGTPVISDFCDEYKCRAKKELGLDEDKPFVLSIFGSLGATKMNEVIRELIIESGESPAFNLIHSSGKSEYKSLIDSLKEKAPDHESKGMYVKEYIYNTAELMRAADLVICRAGASTLAEITASGTPAIIVPSPNVTNNHQEKNARLIENADAAKVILETQLSGAKLLDEINELLSDKERLKTMSDNMKALAHPDAASKIAECVLAL